MSVDAEFELFKEKDYPDFLELAYYLQSYKRAYLTNLWRDWPYSSWVLLTCETPPTLKRCRLFGPKC